MIKILPKFFVIILLTLIANSSIAQNEWNNTSPANDISRDTILKEGYALIFINKDSTFDKTEQRNLISTFFTVYPEEVKEYNPNSLKKSFHDY